MDNLLAARSQMAMSLAFHIVFSAIGIGLPLLMVIAEGLWHYLWNVPTPMKRGGFFLPSLSCGPGAG